MFTDDYFNYKEFLNKAIPKHNVYFEISGNDTCLLKEGEFKRIIIIVESKHDLTYTFNNSLVIDRNIKTEGKDIRLYFQNYNIDFIEKYSKFLFDGFKIYEKESKNFF